MAKQTINIGVTANDGTGDTLRDSFRKVNENTDELYIAGDKASTALQPSDVGSAAFRSADDFATINQGEKADSALQPSDVGSAAHSDVEDFVASNRTVAVGSGLAGGGALSSDVTVGLSSASVASLALANTAAQQSANLSDLTSPQAALLNLGVGSYPVANFGSIVVGNNDAVINAAIDAAYAAGGGDVILPPGTTQATSIILKDKVNLISTGSGSSLLNIGSATYFLNAQGSLGTAIALTADAAAGDATLNVASTTGISVGDYILLGDNYSYAATDANYKSGEIVQVSAVTSSIVLALVGKIYGSMAPGNAYTVANTSIIRRISPIIAPGVQGIQFLGDKSNTSTAMQFSYALNSNISVGVQNYGNTGLLVRGCIGGEAGGCSFDDLTDDVANGHAGYGVCIAGPSMSFRVHDFLASRCRHGITTIGGVTGYPHELLVSDAIARDTSQAGFDCHNAVDGMTLNDCWSIRSGGAGASIRGRNVTLRNFRAQKPASHGVYLAEDGVSNVTLSKFEIEDPGGHGIASSVSCTNLRLTGGDIYRAALDGVHLFDTGIYDSTGLVMRQVNVLGYGLGTTGANGIVTTGSFTTTGAVIEGCLVAPLTGSAAYGIRTLALTGSAVIDNKAMGTFSAASFSLGANIDLGNKRIDGSVPQVRLDSTTSAVRATGPSTNHDLLLLPQGTGGVVRFGTFASEADAPIVGSVSIKTADGVTHKLATIS